MTTFARVLAASGVVLLVVLVAVGVAVIPAVPVSAADGLTRAQQDETLDAHNAWRRLAGVMPLRWAADLADRAQARAAYLAAHGCLMVHGPLPADVGENLFRAGPLRATGRPNVVLAISPASVVDWWGEEAADYAHERDACAPGRQCGHYTQIVWAATREVGCGTAVCPTLGQVWVCNYRPRGNVRVRR